MTINLTRKTRKGNAVCGTIELPFYEDKSVPVDTLENADYLIPEGTYPLRSTWSPKFKKFMPEICDVPDRNGIRIHQGSIREHSTGCVLSNLGGCANINAFINRINQIYDDEQLYICITSEGEAGEAGLAEGSN